MIRFKKRYTHSTRNIGIYMPDWLYRSDKTDRLFADELVKTINESNRYKAVRVNIPNLSLSTSASAKAFCERHNLAVIVQHDSAFYSNSKKYMRNARLLEEQVPLLNSHASHEIGHNKIFTKRLLRGLGIPVLDDVVVSSTEELHNHLLDGIWHVIKPADRGAGTGVKLIKKEQGVFMQYRNGEWCPITVSSKKLKDGKSAITVQRGWNPLSSFTYKPMLVEPYFNDDVEGFASLRCTVVGDEIIEAVKRMNRSNITSNVSSGGTAKKILLSDEQKEMALATVRAIGADYAGVDFLVCGGKSVIGEVNIGPFTVFSAYTDAPVGRKLAEYAMQKSDDLA